MMWSRKPLMMSIWQHFLIRYFLRLAKSKGDDLALYNISASVVKSAMDHGASSSLQTGWLKLFKVPSIARMADAFKL